MNSLETARKKSETTRNRIADLEETAKIINSQCSQGEKKKQTHGLKQSEGKQKNIDTCYSRTLQKFGTAKDDLKDIWCS